MKELSTKYVSVWARNARNVELLPHEYTGKQNHCKACYHEYIRRFRVDKLSVRHEKHDFVSYWHCRACKNYKSALHMSKVRSQARGRILEPHKYAGDGTCCLDCLREFDRLQAITKRLTRREKRELESYQSL